MFIFFTISIQHLLLVKNKKKLTNNKNLFLIIFQTIKYKQNNYRRWQQQHDVDNLSASVLTRATNWYSIQSTSTFLDEKCKKLHNWLFLLEISMYCPFWKMNHEEAVCKFLNDFVE
jgi:hypothetical protein